MFVRERNATFVSTQELTTSQLIVFPTTGGIDAERSLAAGNEQKNTKGETFLVSRLQSFLRNQVKKPILNSGLKISFVAEKGNLN